MKHDKFCYWNLSDTLFCRPQNWSWRPWRLSCHWPLCPAFVPCICRLLLTVPPFPLSPFPTFCLIIFDLRGSHFDPNSFPQSWINPHSLLCLSKISCCKSPPLTTTCTLEGKRGGPENPSSIIHYILLPSWTWLKLTFYLPNFFTPETFLIYMQTNRFLSFGGRIGEIDDPKMGNPSSFSTTEIQGELIRFRVNFPVNYLSSSPCLPPRRSVAF